MTRKHSGINQTTNKLNKGYMYSGKKLASGLPQIIQSGGSIFKKTQIPTHIDGSFMMPHQIGNQPDNFNINNIMKNTQLKKRFSEFAMKNYFDENIIFLECLNNYIKNPTNKNLKAIRECDEKHDINVSSKHKRILTNTDVISMTDIKSMRSDIIQNLTSQLGHFKKYIT
jgi:hypothetical protein